MPAALITRFHFTVSLAKNLAATSGEPPSGVTPMSRHLPCMSGAFIHASISVFNLRTMSIGTFAAVGSSVYAAIHGRIQAHRRGMIMTYVGLVVAGVFTLLPGRRFGDIVWHAAGLI